MNKNYYINDLGPKELEKMKSQIDNWSKMMDEIAENIVKDLAEYGLEKMEEIYNNFDFSGSEPMSFYISGTPLEKDVTMYGKQAIYNEFGTGTLGQRSPHPGKKRFNLNEYNSGKTIRPATKGVTEKTGIPTGELYWTYKDANGEVRYTQGTPAQKEGYDSLLATIEKSDEIIKKNFQERIFK